MDLATEQEIFPPTAAPQPLVILNGAGIRPKIGIALPALFSPDLGTARRVLEFFTVNISNLHTRKAYGKAAGEFAAWCESHGIEHLRDVQPMHVAAYIEELQGRIAAPSVKLQLAGIRSLFDWLVVGQVMPTNPASASSVMGQRDRALIALMTFTFARVSAAAEKMRVEDFYVQGRRTWVRLHEKGGKRHEMPCHHKLDAYLAEYITAAGLAGNPKGYLFRSIYGLWGTLTERPMSRNDVYRMIRRRAPAAGIKTRIGCHTFRATGITDYLRNGGKLEVAQQMANHESARTTGLYDRRNDQVSLDEVERILI